MQALREIREITSDTITINVPAAFRHHRVEIILLPLDEETQKDQALPKEFFERFAGCLPDFPRRELEGGYEERGAL